jgi:hypothetical protein
VNKANAIEGLVKKGDYKFKIYTENNSIKSKRALLKICQLLKTSPGPTTEEH